MTANFNAPTVSTLYTNFPTQVRENFVAVAQQFSVGTPLNVPAGSIKWDSTDNRWKIFDGNNYNDLTSTYNFNAALTATGLDMGDSSNSSGGTNAILLGASDDLRIFHDGSNSYIRDFNGTGNLLVTTNQLNIKNNGDSEFMAKFIQGGSVELYEDNTKRFETTTAGCAITGQITTTGQAAIGTNITTDGSGGVGDRLIRIGAGRTGNGNSYLDLVSDATNTTYGARFIRGNSGANTTTNLLHRGTGQLQISANDAGKIALRTNGSTRLFIDQNGQVSIGSTSPQKLFEVANGGTPEMIIRSSAASSQDAILRLRGARTGSPTDINQIIFETNDTGGGNYTAGSRLGSIICGKRTNNTTKGFLDFRLNNTTITDGSLGTSNASKLYISGANQVGISTTAPQRLLELASADQTSIIRLHSTDTTIQTDNRIGMIEFSGSDSGASGIAAFIEAIASSNAGAAELRFATGIAGSSAEAARFDQDGRLLIGHTDQRNSRVGTANISPDLQIHSDTQGAMSITRYTNGTSSGRLHIQKARGTAASPLVAVDGDTLCDFTMSGYDGSNFTNGARIIASINGTVASNAMPTDVKFQIRDDSGTLNTNYVMSHDRFFGIIKTSPSLPLHVKQLVDDAGVMRLEDTDSNNKYADFDITNGNLSVTARNNTTSGTFKLVRNNGSTSAEILRTDTSGRVAIGTTTIHTNDKLSVAGGRISTNDFVIAGRGEGGVALTHNDGGGNANVTFNHVNQTPEQNGTSGRIDVNCDSTGGVATMNLGLLHSATSGTSSPTSDVIQLKRGTQAALLGSGSVTTLRNQLQNTTGTATFPAYSFQGDADTGISRSAADRMSLIAGGTEIVRINSNGLDVRSGSLTADNAAKAWISFKGTDTFAVQTSYNVDSITDIGVGHYRVTYDTNMTNAQHVVLITGSISPSGNNTHGVPYMVSRAANTCTMKFIRDENSNDLTDKDAVMVATFDG